MNSPSDGLLKVDLRLIARHVRSAPHLVHDGSDLTLVLPQALDDARWEKTLRDWLSPLELHVVQVDRRHDVLRLRAQALVEVRDWG